MAAGNAILARETASNREVLDDAGLFWHSSEELGQLLREVWPDPERRKRLGECAGFGALRLGISDDALPGAMRAVASLNRL
jgi:hypothetical protein